MANNVYIGNRYVPVFANPVEWDNLRSYEPLTIVTYQGTAYTSKKTVPVGTALSNTEYWVVTGNYNAQVEQYRQEVVALSNETEALKQRGDLLETGSVILLGDSYGVDSATGGNSWLTQVRNNLGSVIKAYDATGGIGFVSEVYQSVNTNWLQKLTAIKNNLSSAELSKIKRIFVVGGANDANTIYGTPSYMTQLDSNIDAFINYAGTNFPNAMVYICFVGWYVDSQRWTQYYNVKKAYEYHASTHKNSMFVGDADYILHVKKFINSTDLIHPTADGSFLLGRAMTEIVKRPGQWNLRFSTQTTPTASSNVTLGQLLTYVRYDGALCEIDLRGTMSGLRWTIDFTNPQAANYDAKFNLMTNDYFPICSDLSFCSPAEVTVLGVYHDGSTEKYVTRHVRFYFEGGILKCYFCGLPQTGEPGHLERLVVPSMTLAFSLVQN